MRSEDLPDDLALLLDVRRAVGTSLQQQLIDQLREGIASGQLAPGRRLPATRVLSAALGISRNITEAAYDELVAQGYLMRRHGSGTYVDGALPRLPLVERSMDETSPNRTSTMPRWLRGNWPEEVGAPPPGDAIVFAPGVPDVSLLPTGVWRAIWREVGKQKPPAGYGPPAGDPELRAALADYICRARGLACLPDDIVVTAGAMQALDLLARATLMPGDTVAFEEPGYSMARHALAAHGARIIPIPVDDDGLDTAALEQSPGPPVLVYVTPSHQFPLGARLPVARRMALLDWAARSDSLIVEDDYDSEYRFDAPPLPALAGLDRHGRVAYIGTFSKLLTPALRAAYLVTPSRDLRRRIELLKGVSDFHVSWPVQRALLALITEGHLDRHIRRMRRHYADKRAIMSRILQPLAPAVQIRGLEAGLHAYLALGSALNAGAIVRMARERGVVVLPVGSFYHGTPDRQGLVLGYGGLTPSEIARGAEILRDVIVREAG